jgi:hypothetical protein
MYGSALIPDERRIGRGRRRCDVLPVPQPFMKTRLVIMKDKRFSVGRFHPHSMPPGFFGLVDHRLAAEATVASLDWRIGN